ncbi:Protein of unknown function [Gryllus bimaculatus]|nr:Protein of unknown function [Gryllus bimaculatus]
MLAVLRSLFRLVLLSPPPHQHPLLHQITHPLLHQHPHPLLHQHPHPSFTQQIHIPFHFYHPHTPSPSTSTALSFRPLTEPGIGLRQRGGGRGRCGQLRRGATEPDSSRRPAARASPALRSSRPPYRKSPDRPRRAAPRHVGAPVRRPPARLHITHAARTQFYTPPLRTVQQGKVIFVRGGFKFCFQKRLCVVLNAGSALERHPVFLRNKFCLALGSSDLKADCRFYGPLSKQFPPVTHVSPGRW